MGTLCYLNLEVLPLVNIHKWHGRCGVCIGRWVDDTETMVAELRKREIVVFEEYDLPGLKKVNGIAEVSCNYLASGGIGERGSLVS
jgi:hypothetical protein